MALRKPMGIAQAPHQKVASFGRPASALSRTPQPLHLASSTGMITTVAVSADHCPGATSSLVLSAHRTACWTPSARCLLSNSPPCGVHSVNLRRPLRSQRPATSQRRGTRYHIACATRGRTWSGSKARSQSAAHSATAPPIAMAFGRRDSLRGCRGSRGRWHACSSRNAWTQR